MIDKLIIKSKRRIDPTNLLKAIEPEVWTYTEIGASKFYGSGRRFVRLSEANGKPECYMVLLNDPKLKASASRVLLNPNLTSLKYDGLLSILSQVSDVETCEIARIDFCLDLKIPITALHRTLAAKGKSLATEFWSESYKGNQLQSFYLGSRKQSSVVYCRGGKDKTLKGITRIEVREMNDLVRFRNLTELPRYKEIEIAPRLQLWELSEVHGVEQAKIGERLKALRTHIDLIGMHRALKLANKSNNFKRDYEHLIQPCTSMENLNDQFRKSITKFFGEKNDQN